MFSKSQKLKRNSGRAFQDQWTTDFGVIEKNNKAFCCLCTDTVVSRTFNVRRHFETNHKNVCSMSNEERLDYISRNVKQYKNQSNSFATFTCNGNDASTDDVDGSFNLSRCISQQAKPLSDGEILKAVFLATSDVLFKDFPNKQQIVNRIMEMPVNRNSKPFEVTSKHEALQEGHQGDSVENTSGVEDGSELGFGYGVNHVATLEHSDTEPSGSVNPFTASKRQKIQHRISTLKNVVNDHKNMSMSHTNQSEENEFDIYGLYVSTSLKKLSLPRAIRLQEKINSLIADERISYDSQSSPCSNNGMAERNHGSDNDDMDHSSKNSYMFDSQNDIKIEEVEIECEPELNLSL